MKSNESESFRTSDSCPLPSALPRWIVVVATLATLMGTAVRCIGLDRKTVWFDETYSTLMIHGQQPTAALAAIFDGISTAGEVTARVESKPASGVRATIKDLFINDPHHAPLFYGALNVWARSVGSSFAALRLLAALGGVAALAAAFWAGREMHGDATATLLMAIVAVSPFQLAYSQEAREYTFWSAALLLQFGTLVRALRANETRHWAAYAGATALAFYVHPFTVLVAAAQAASVFLFGLKTNRKMPLALAAAAVAGAPWLIVLYVRRGIVVSATRWLRYGGPLSMRMLHVFEKWSYPFFSPRPDSPPHGMAAGVALAVAAAAVIVAIRGLRSADRPIAAVLVAGLTAVTVPLLTADIVGGGSRSQHLRYNFPGIIALEAGVALFLAVAPPKRRAFGFVAVLTLGVVSDALYMRANDWWTKLDSNRALMGVVSDAPAPLVIVDERDEIGGIRLAAFATGLRPDVQLLRTLPGEMNAVPGWRGRDVFVVWPTEEMGAWAKAQGADKIPAGGAVYHLAPR